MADKGEHEKHWDQEAKKNKEQAEKLNQSLQKEMRLKSAFKELYDNLDEKNEVLKLENIKLSKIISENKIKMERHYYYPGIILGLILCSMALYATTLKIFTGKEGLGFCLLVFIISINPNLSDSFIKGILAILRKFFRQD